MVQSLRGRARSLLHLGLGDVRGIPSARNSRLATLGLIPVIGLGPAFFLPLVQLFKPCCLFHPRTGLFLGLNPGMLPQVPLPIGQALVVQVRTKCQ